MSRRNDVKERVWSGHLTGWRSSGLSRRAYCEQEGLSASSFDYWQRRLRVKVTAGTDKGLTLVPVQLEKPASAATWILRSPGGWSLELPAAVTARFVADVLKRLP